MPKKTTMEAKVAAIEAELSDLRSTLTEVQNTAKANQEHLIAMLERCLVR